MRRTKMAIADEIREKMQTLGFKLYKLDECGNCAYVKSFCSGQILVFSLDSGELYDPPSRSWEEDIGVHVYDKHGEIVLTSATTLNLFIEAEEIASQ
jgi:hypothetical protein